MHSGTLHPFPLLVPFRSLTSKDLSAPVLCSLHGSHSESRCVRGRAGATVQGDTWGRRGKLPQQQPLNLAACISLPNPADKSRCTFPCVIARLSEGTGYLRTCFHRGVILCRVVWDSGFTCENTVMLWFVCYTLITYAFTALLCQAKSPYPHSTGAEFGVPLASSKYCLSSEKACYSLHALTSLYLLPILCQYLHFQRESIGWGETWVPSPGAYIMSNLSILPGRKDG